MTFERGEYKGTPVLLLDAATGSDKTFDWANKITISLPPHSVSQVLAVLCRWSPAYTERGHGGSHDKSISIKAQASNHFLSVAKGSLTCAAPIDPGKVYLLLDLCTSILLAASALPQPTPKDIWAQVRITSSSTTK